MNDYNNKEKLELYDKTFEKDYLKHFLVYSLFNTVNKYISNKAVLQIPCGTGNLSLDMLNNGAKCIVGIDLSLEVVEHAKRRFESEDISSDKYLFLQHDATIVKQLINELSDVALGRHLFCFAKNFDDLVQMARMVYVNLKASAYFISYSCPIFKTYSSENVKQYESLCDLHFIKYENVDQSQEWPKTMSHEENGFLLDRHIWPNAFVVRALEKAGFLNVKIEVLKPKSGYEHFEELNTMFDFSIIIAQKLN